MAGWHSARAALAAQSLLSGSADMAFLQGKIGTAQFYMQHVLPQTGALAQAILEGGEAVAGFDVALF